MFLWTIYNYTKITFTEEKILLMTYYTKNVGRKWEIGLKRKTCSSVNSDTTREIIISVHNGSLFSAASGDEVLSEVIRRQMLFCTMFRVMIRK